jgi:hypothetical protein
MNHSTALVLSFGLLALGNESSFITDSPLTALILIEVGLVLVFVLLTAWMPLPANGRR